ncbi:hypothetical protein E3T55_17200 [Cryobacterium frigoriphilum]|uniref:Uncharacterized protein n=1 Tax=Cryobacterium frigoriphilum TaxID=1259150 RepID=A0A4R8ZUC5_9MICO|nr:hypothetical protein [Cryobacterium frigoriphilum]TFD46349.1 hypothetical protein E3T55_17200 [Cryobacterium frigoriphilum]
MAGTYGADVEHLRNLAQHMSTASEQLDRTRLTVGNQIKISAWVGPFAATFKAQWESEHSRRIATVVRLLEENAARLRTNAEEQEKASTVDGSENIARSGSRSHDEGQSAPKDTRAMIAALERMSSNDGILIQKVVGSDGVTRYVVYIKGTDGSDNPLLLSKLENATAINGLPGTTDVYLDALLSRVIDPPDAEIMVIGHSQGGMHAEILAQSGRFNVTDVITINSPAITQHNNLHGANVLRLADVNRESLGEVGAVNTDVQNPATGGIRDIVARVTGEGEKGIQKHFLGTSDASEDDGIWRAHDSQVAHEQIAEQFDQSQNEEDRAIRLSMARYQNGTVVSEID